MDHTLRGVVHIYKQTKVSTAEKQTVLILIIIFTGHLKCKRV
jgi:hypothetical protein